MATDGQTDLTPSGLYFQPFNKDICCKEPFYAEGECTATRPCICHAKQGPTGCFFKAADDGEQLGASTGISLFFNPVPEDLYEYYNLYKNGYGKGGGMHFPCTDVHQCLCTVADSPPPTQPPAPPTPPPPPAPPLPPPTSPMPPMAPDGAFVRTTQELNDALAVCRVLARPTPYPALPLPHACVLTRAPPRVGRPARRTSSSATATTIRVLRASKARIKSLA